jgi:ComF family protein
MKAAGASVSVEISDVQRDKPQKGFPSTWLHATIAAAIDLLFPPRCVACAAQFEPQPGAVLLCPSCDTSLAIDQRPTCPRCAMRCSEIDVPRGNCGDCRSRKLLFTAARTIGPYQGALRTAVLKGKHALHEPLVKALGQRLAETIRQFPFADPPELVVPVPTHWLKQLWRKANPASTVGESLAGQLGIPWHGRALVCRRYLQRQANLTPPERRKNVRGAFYARSRSNLAGKRILLVDDVMTTGATANEGARALLAAGATAVYVATVSRSSVDS